MRKTLTLFIASLLAMPSFADDRSEQEMQTIALQALCSSNLQAGGAKKAAANIAVEKYQSLDMVNVYGIKGKGVVFISKDDDIEPVLGISDEDFDVNNMPCGMKWWLNTANKSLERMKAKGITYSANPMAASGRPTYFIKTYWNQDKPFNNLCPQINGSAAPTGCIATAMAQIMKYYQYPATSKGTGIYSVTTYKDKNDKDGTTKWYKRELGHTYQWTAMLSSYGIVSEDENDAVATLMADAGAASQMNYQANGSGTIAWYAAKGFAENFRYDSLAISCLQRDFYTDAEWMELVRKEMEAKQPVLYCGSDEIDGGHAFLLDGIQEDGKVHVNWGWGKSGDGWFDIDVLRPNITGFTGEGFNIGQSMVLGFKKQETPSADEENISQWVTDGYSFYISNNELHVKLTNAYNYSHRVFDGKLDIVLQGMGDNSSKLYTDPIFETDTETPYVDMLSGFNYGDKDQPEVDFNLSQEPELKNISAGTYKLFLGSKSTKEKAYQCLRSVGGTIMYTLTVASDGTMTLAQDGTSAISAVAVKQNISAPYTYIYNMQGLEVYKSKTQDFCLDDVPAHGVLIVKQGDTTRKVVK
nr:C10 family peptidase [Prevotella sp.]